MVYIFVLTVSFTGWVVDGTPVSPSAVTESVLHTGSLRRTRFQVLHVWSAYTGNGPTSRKAQH
jgi:hypothetical protein